MNRICKILTLLICLLSAVVANGQTDIAEQAKETAIKAHIKKAVVDEIDHFLYLLEEIAEKQEAAYSREENMIEARSYFTKTAIVEVSSLNNTQLKKITIADYLSRFELLPYDRIELELEQAEVSSVEKVTEGIYKLSGVFKQKFEGYKNGTVAYGDITWKEILVQVTEISNPYLDEPTYSIKFNYIKVLRTEPIPKSKGSEDD